VGLFDTVYCDYPLPDPGHQDWSFETKSLDCGMHTYTITRDGRLIRHAGRGGDRDFEFPFHGDVEMYTADVEQGLGLIRYAVRFSRGRVEWVRKIGEGRAVADEEPAVAPTTDPSRPAPSTWGRRLTADEFARAPEKLELVDGRIPGGTNLVILLLTAMGLRRVAALVGFERWRSALPGSDEPADVQPEDGVEAGVYGPRPHEVRLLAQLKSRRERLLELLAGSSDHWGFEDPIYRYYHQSFKVYRLQQQTKAIVAELAALLPGQPLNLWFLEILERGTGKQFRFEDNANWTQVTRPMLEAFFHARYFLEMAVRYAHLDAPPSPLPSGYAALLYLYGLR
jgi:hypothetical protein